MSSLPRKILRAAIVFVAGIAGLVIIFDNSLSGTAGLVLLGSVVILGLCGIAWLIFDLGEDTHRGGKTQE